MAISFSTMNHDVSELMLSSFSGNENDTFGKDKDARLPLLLPKVMEGRPIKSTSLLCRLPPEILGDIMDLIADDKSTLSALALVNSDCRQLARSCQFADVCFDYSPNSRLLMLQLMKECITRLGHDDPSNTTRPPYIGPCIRRVVVKPRPEWVAHAHSDLYDAIFGDAASDLSPEQRNELSERATDQYIATFRTPLQVAMELAMPHLEALSWHDRLCLDGAFFRTVANLPIRHLSLTGVHIGEIYRLEPPVTPLVVPLESLSLRVRLCSNERAYRSKLAADPDADTADADTWRNRSLSPFIETLLWRCSTTLRRLTLSCEALTGDRSLSFGYEDIFFTRLRYLDISRIMSNPNVRVWSSLFSAPLRHLSVPFNDSLAFKQALSACEPLRDLETLVVPYLDGKGMGTAQPIIDFISRHPHVHKLSIGRSTPELLDFHLIPLLSDGRWSSLSSLSLVWSEPIIAVETQPDTATISAASLDGVGSIESLEQLCLSAGQQFGWRHQWLIDHDAVRLRLLGLAKLKRLAFSRDTYLLPDGVSGHGVERYYEDRLVTSAERNDALERPELDRVGDAEHVTGGEGDSDGPGVDSTEVWERAHRNRMLREAEKYAGVFPHLEWIYCGQWPMKIWNKPILEGVTRVALPLVKERDSCWTLLERMFAMGGDDE